MEVHHHGHLHSNNKWKEYLFQFFMLFLAVFCGSLAEWQLEHQIEHRHEKEFMSDLLQDLQSDTAVIQHTIIFGRKVCDKKEALCDFIFNEKIVGQINRLYELNEGSSRVVQARFEDRTSSQLKNSGGMRLIRQKAVADSIREYWNRCKILDNIAERMEMIRIKESDLYVRIFNSSFYSYSDKSNPLNSEIKVKPGAKLIDNDPRLLMEYANRGAISARVLNNYIRTLKEAKITAVRLMEVIRDKYQIED